MQTNVSKLKWVDKSLKQDLNGINTYICVTRKSHQKEKNVSEIFCVKQRVNESLGCIYI